MFGQLFKRAPAAAPLPEALRVADREVPLRFVRHPRARRYLLRVRADGSVRVTVPNRGSLAEARSFVERQLPWIQTQLKRLAEAPARSTVWQPGTLILWRGNLVSITTESPGIIRLGEERIAATNTTDLRPEIQAHLQRLAARELPPRTLALAAAHGLTVRRITVRNQRSRWGSCSRRSTISLNWRLIQTPDWVRDYIIFHELAHLREMNHSARFWAEVERLCPDYRTAERWLKEQHHLLR
jgi:predicted metal-dependent hydrolase